MTSLHQALRSHLLDCQFQNVEWKVEGPQNHFQDPETWSLVVWKGSQPQQQHVWDTAYAFVAGWKAKTRVDQEVVDRL